MTLRVRILIGYGYLVALLLLAASSALLGFFYLSARFDQVLEGNYASVRAAMAMIEALERQDSATLAALLERRDSAEGMVSLESAFEEALRVAEGRIGEEGEAEIVQDIHHAASAYRRERDQLLAQLPEHPLAMYEQSVYPRFVALKAQVIRLLELNQEAMIRAAREARQSALQSAAWLGFLVTIALVSLVFLSRALQRDILSRIAQVRRDLSLVASGDLQRRLHEVGDDELATISHDVNELLERIQRAEGRARAQVAGERQVVLALVAAAGDRATFYHVNGIPAAGERAAASGADAVGRWIAEEGRHRLAGASGASGAPEIRELVRDGDTQWDVELLRAGPRPVGWLARPAEG
jgi:hypothetical protein